MRGLFLPDIAGMRGVGMIEGFAVDVLGVIGKMYPDGVRQIGICSIRHEDFPRLFDGDPLTPSRRAGIVRFV